MKYQDKSESAPLIVKRVEYEDIKSEGSVIMKREVLLRIEGCLQTQKQ